MCWNDLQQKSKEEGSLKVVNNQPNNRSGYIMMFADAKHNIKTRHVVDLLMRLPVVFFKDEANDDGHIQHSHKIICYCVKQIIHLKV